jgi:transposase InsO family protein
MSGYEVTDIPLQVPALNKELLAWERVYNTVRPHQSLGYLTPQQFLTQWKSQREEVKCH